MRNRILPILIGLCLIAGVSAAQTSPATYVTPNNGVTYNWPPVTTTGQLGSYLYQFQNGVTSGSSNFNIDWTDTGTAPSACTFRVEGSSDGIAWTGLDIAAPGTDPLPCTLSNMVFITDKPVRFVRVNIVSYTAGDATTVLIFHYTRGSQ